MRSQLKSLVKEIVPPIFLKSYQRQSTQYGFFGDYKSWQEAHNASTGYDTSIILEKVKTSLLRVKQGQAAYARDSVVFDQIQYSFPLLAALLRIAAENLGKLSVLDFGGSLGTSYYQCKDFLSPLSQLKWSIVEQENFVSCGQQLFEDDSLKFFYNIDSCLQVESPDVIFMSGVVQCLEKPYDFLEEILKYNFKNIIFDRTAFTREGRDLLTVQKVPPDIYAASYPAWFLNQDRFLNIFMSSYDLVFEFNSSDQVNVPSDFKGFYLRKK
jgi:putative methyltransferase (TIGR04325 family)